MLSIKNISAGYDKKAVLSDVSMDIRKGEFIGLIGPNVFACNTAGVTPYALI